MSSRKSADIQEAVEEVVQIYLQRRNFNAAGEEGGVSRAERTQPLQELAADMWAERSASGANVLAYTAAQMEPATADAQFARFRAWVLESPEPYQSALQQLLYPVFISLHLELVLGGHSPTRFYARHHGPFLCEPERQPPVAELARVSTADDLQRSQPLQHHRCNPPEVALSVECSEYLRRALRGGQLPLVLQAVSQHVRLAAAAGRAAADTDDGRQGRRRYTSGPASSQTLWSGAASEDADAAGELRRAAGRLRAEPPPPPTVCAYRVGRPLACAALAPPLHVLVAGDEHGAVVLALSAGGVAATDNPASRLPLGTDATAGRVSAGRASASRQLRGHAGAVFDLAFEPGGAALVTAGEDSTLRAWKTDTWANVCIYRGHTYPVWSVACQRAASTAAASHYFVSGSMDRTARLWSFDRTYQLRIFAGHTQDVDCVAMHPNGNYVCSASADGTVRLWSLTDAAQLRVLSGHRGVIHDLQFSPDGKQLAAAGEDRHVRVYDLGMGAVVNDLSAHVATVSSLLWTPGGRTLVSADRDGAINTWNLSYKSAADALPACTFVCPGWSAVRLQYAPHNYLLAVYGEQDS